MALTLCGEELVYYDVSTCFLNTKYSKLNHLFMFYIEDNMQTIYRYDNIQFGYYLLCSFTQSPIIQEELVFKRLIEFFNDEIESYSYCKDIKDQFYDVFGKYIICL